MVLHATGLIGIAQRFAAEATSFAGRAHVVVLPPPCPIRVHPMDFGHADALIRRAEADARTFLDGRTRTVVPLRRRHRRAGPDARIELPPAS